MNLVCGAQGVSGINKQESTMVQYRTFRYLFSVVLYLLHVLHMRYKLSTFFLFISEDITLFVFVACHIMQQNENIHHQTLSM